MANKKLTQTDQLKAMVVKMKGQFAAALPAHIKPEKFVRVIQTATINNPGLVKADRQSFFSACMKLAEQGLLPDGNEAAIVTFKDKCQAMPMVAGILKKVRNSGELLSITAQVVHENDEFKYWTDEKGEHLTHTPEMFKDRGKRVGVYALATTKDGAVYIEVMSSDQVEAIKKMARSKNVWDGPFANEMWKKSAIRRLSKRLPMSTDLEMTIRSDDEMYDLDEPTEPAPEPQEQTTPSRLEDVIEAKAEPVSEPEKPSKQETPI